MTSRTHWWSAALVALALTAATACSEPAPKIEATNTTSPAAVAGCSPSTLLACARKSTLTKYVPAKAIKATGTPIHPERGAPGETKVSRRQ